MLFDNLSGDHVHSISLIETDTFVADITLSAGTFLYSRSGNDKTDIWHFAPTGVGFGLTSGTHTIFIDGNDTNIDEEEHGMDLIETTLTIGGTTLQSGTILLTLKKDDSAVGDNGLDTKAQDIFYLDVTSTLMGSGTSSVDAYRLLDGSDVNLNSSSENILGFSLAPVQ